MSRYCLLCLAAVLLALPGHAVEIAVPGGLLLEIALADGWSVHSVPPDPLVRELARHVAHDPAAAGATAAEIETVARNRLSANQAIVYHAASGAHLDIDFSPLEPGAAPPDLQALRDSAQYAAWSLEKEPDVTALSWAATPFKVHGAGTAMQLAADYRQHDLPRKFLGIVGYAAGAWFFLYYTDPCLDPAIYAEMQAMLSQLVVRRRGP